MPEPVTVAIIAVSAVVLTAIGYKAVEVIAKAPANLVVTTTEATKDVIRAGCDGLRELFGAQPRFSVDQEVKQKADPIAICELCLARVEIEVKAKFENTWMKSTKRFVVRETFVLKAGYDLNRLKLDFDSKKKNLRVTISEATIINVLRKKDLKMEEDEGLWNKLKPEDLERAINSLPDLARDEAKRSGVYAMAETQSKIVLELLFKPCAFSVDVSCLDDTIVFENERELGDISKETRRKLGLIEDVRSNAGGFR